MPTRRNKDRGEGERQGSELFHLRNGKRSDAALHDNPAGEEAVRKLARRAAEGRGIAPELAEKLYGRPAP